MDLSTATGNYLSRYWFRLVFVALGCLPVAVLAQAPATFESPIPAMTELDLSQGQSLFQVHCSRCHGMLGEGGEGPSLKRPRLR